MHAGQVASNRYKSVRPLRLTASEYFRRNTGMASSGVPWAPPTMHAREVTGPDQVMYAMDYPYQYLDDEVRMQDALPLSTEERKQFFKDNATRVFGLDEAAITRG